MRCSVTVHKSYNTSMELRQFTQLKVCPVWAYVGSHKCMQVYTQNALWIMRTIKTRECVCIQTSISLILPRG